MIVFLAFDFTNFVGRFHPLLVHLPIGFLLLGVLMEGYQRFRKTEKLSPLISYAWILSGIGGAFAAFCGWWLGETGLYLENDLFLHRWIGIAIVIISFVGGWIKKNDANHTKILHYAVNILVIGLITIEGHLGGNLTHGEDYLFEYAPEPLRDMMLRKKLAAADLSRADSVIIYKDLIQPIFESKCIACHNNEVQRGKLNMAHIDSMLIGGDGEPAFTPGSLNESELFRRITLPQKNVKFMPPVGEPLTYDEIKIVAWWIEQGATSEAKITDVEVPEEVKPTLLRTYGIDTNPKPYYQMVHIEPLDSVQITDLTKNGFTVKVLGGENPLLDVKFTGENLTLDLLKTLEPAAEHITWLSLAQTNINDEWLTVLSKFENLTRLQLEKTTVSDKGIKVLSNLKHLEVLNLYDTKVTNASVPFLQKMDGLKRVYLWQTGISPTDAKSLEDSNKELTVIAGQG